MIRPSARLASAAMLVALFLPISKVSAQQDAPSSPAPAPAPQAQAAPAAPIEFPKPDPADFTAASPTKEVVNAFMDANLGFDENNIWQVQAITKDPD